MARRATVYDHHVIFPAPYDSNRRHSAAGPLPWCKKDAKLARMRAPRYRRRFFGVLAVLSSSRAYASEFATAQLQTYAPERADCASSATLASAVEAHLQRQMFVRQPSADLDVKVAYAREPKHWVADIELKTAAGRPLGRRKLSSQASECSAMNESLALILALMVDLTRAEVTTRSAPAVPGIATEVHVAEPPAPASAWLAQLSLTGQLRLGQLPDLAAGAGLATVLRHRSGWGPRLGVAAWLPSSEQDHSTRAGARFSAYVAEIGLCRELQHAGRLELSLCTGSELGLLRGQGIGYQRSQTARTPLIDPYALAESTWWPTAHLGLQLGLSVTFPLIRDQFYATRSDGSEIALFKPAAVVPSLRVGICLQL